MENQNDSTRGEANMIDKEGRQYHIKSNPTMILSGGDMIVYKCEDMYELVDVNKADMMKR